MQLEDSAENFYTNETNGTLSSDDVSGPSSEYSSLNQIYIYVIVPLTRVSHIKLNPNNSISVLNQVYQPNSMYIFNGKILDIQKSFVYYRICSENKIVNISQSMLKKDPNIVEKWMKLTSDKENFEKKVDTSINKKNRNEIARLRDMKFIKCEFKKKHLGSYLQKFHAKKTNNIFEYEKEDLNLNLDYEKTDSPSCEALPILW